MGLRFPEVGQFESYTRSDYALAALQLCYLNHGNDVIHLTSCATRESGRPIVIVSLDQLQPGQFKENARIIRSIAEQAIPHEKEFIEKWDWEQSGELNSLNSSSIRVNTPRDPSLSSRMTGDFWANGSVIAIANRYWSEREVVSNIIGVSVDMIEYCPSGILMCSGSLAHEGGHTHQLSPTEKVQLTYKSTESDYALAFDMEDDADHGALASSLIVSSKLPERQYQIRDAMDATIKGRALNAFRGAASLYCNALRLDGNKAITSKEADLHNRELRFRTYARMNNIALPSSSADIKTILATPFSNNVYGTILQQAFMDLPWDWGRCNEIDKSIPYLHSVKDEITDPLTARNAELVIEAATYFRPSVANDFSRKTYIQMPTQSQMQKYGNARPAFSAPAYNP